ncbi:hypothetical protein [Aliarcobacter cryaerophilus]|uniref:hypothetical protein n=1 Tax=Aliarcobacter cryaerophilus TaxID=28198 RepID=UPI003DA4BD10
MKIFFAIVVSVIIVWISAFLFNILKIVMEDNRSLIGILIQFIPFVIGIWLIKYSWTKITYSEEPKETNENTKTLAKAVINHSKELVQEVKPAINNYIEKHTKNDEIVIKNDSKYYDNAIFEDINEDELYEEVMIEIEEDRKIKSTWAKALSQSDGDKDKAESLYIKLRVDFLIQEKKEQIELEKKRIKEQEFILKQEQEQKKLEEEQKILQENINKTEREKLKNRNKNEGIIFDKDYKVITKVYTILLMLIIIILIISIV